MPLCVGFLFLSSLLNLFFCKIYIHESFDQPESITRWIFSKDTPTPRGAISRVQKAHCSDGDFALKFVNDSSYYHFSTELPEVLDTKKLPLFVGFVAQYEQDIDCGGAYIKLFETLDPEKLNGNTPYSMMIGPDVCGYGTRKTHLIISHKGQNYQLKNPETFNVDTKPHLIMVKIDTDRSFYLKVDDEIKKQGSLKDHFDYLLPKKIDDPEDKKPEDWVDDAFIPDPNDSKPADWDETEHIPDPDAKRPDDWDDEKDGVWERDMIKNPNYKGVWAPKQISNPAYKGVWVPKQIDNPDFVEDNTFGDKEIKHIGFDIWTVKSGTLFDEIFLSDAEKEAAEYSKNVMEKIKVQNERIKADEEEKRKLEESKAPEEEPKDEDMEPTPEEEEEPAAEGEL